MHVALLSVFVVATVMTSPVPQDALGAVLVRGVPVQNADPADVVASDAGIDSRPIWEGGKDVKPWLVNQPNLAEIRKSNEQPKDIKPWLVNQPNIAEIRKNHQE